MTLRCTICSSFIFYDEKREKMTTILKCPSGCNGKIEMMKGSGKLSGNHPIYHEKTFTSKLINGPYFYAYKNDKGECFVWNDDKLVPVTNPIQL